MVECIYVGIGGFIGSVCRHLIGKLPFAFDNGFPIKTMLINIVGAFFISLFAIMATKNENLSPNVILMLRVGICGGFTTFSTFAFESFNLFDNGQPIVGIAYIVISVIGSIAAIFLAQYFFA